MVVLAEANCHDAGAKPFGERERRGCRTRGSFGSPSILCLVRTLAAFPVGFCLPYPALDHLRVLLLICAGSFFDPDSSPHERENERAEWQPILKV